MAYVYVNLYYGGNWVDYVYNDGRQMSITIERNAATFNLKYKILDICNFLGQYFNIFYTKKWQVLFEFERHFIIHFQAVF